ncbi:hypothetical protein XaFJ1_GM000201 [Xanthomonas albilineans]|nr:hypothetical protein XaFJ1_GM000201 [Xanthomonas albilineans]
MGLRHPGLIDPMELATVDLRLFQIDLHTIHQKRIRLMIDAIREMRRVQSFEHLLL